MVTSTLANDNRQLNRLSIGLPLTIVCAAFIVVPLIIAHAEVKSGDLITWMKYDLALAKAKQENKHVIVNFTTSWCGWCKKMKASTYRNPEVVKTIGDRFVAAVVDGDSYDVLKLNEGDITEKGLTLQYGVRGYPTTWFLEPSGAKIAPAPGFIDSTAMQYILDYVGNNYNDEMAFTDYITLQQKLGTLRPQAKLKLGMTAAQVKATWGAPQSVETKTLPKGPAEEWLYSDNLSLTFRGGKLYGVSDRTTAATPVKEKAAKP